MADSDVEDDEMYVIVSGGELVEPTALGIDERVALNEQLDEFDRVRARGAAMAAADPNAVAGVR